LIPTILFFLNFIYSENYFDKVLSFAMAVFVLVYFIINIKEFSKTELESVNQENYIEKIESDESFIKQDIILSIILILITLLFCYLPFKYIFSKDSVKSDEPLDEISYQIIDDVYGLKYDKID